MVSRLFSFRDLRLLVVSFMALVCTSAALAAPIAPSNLRGAVLTSTSFQIVWDDNSTDETGFFLVYSFNGNAQTPVALGASAGTGTLATSFSGLTGWNTATVQIRADNAAGSSFSNAVNLIFNTAFNAPVSPLTKANADGTLVFMWTDDSSSEAGYIAEIATAAAGTYTTWGTTGANATAISGGLAPSTTYYFRVKAFQGTAASPTATVGPTSVVSGTTAVLAPPTTLTATTASEGTVNLAWVDNCAVEGGYSVYYKPSSSSTYTFITYAAANATTYQVTGLSPGTSYDFQVATAYQSTTVIESTRSNTATTTTKDGFTSLTYQPITYNQAFSYQAVVSTAFARNSWSITGLPTGLTFNSSTGVVSGTPTVSGAFLCPMTASFGSGANAWTTNSTLQLRIVRPPAAPVNATTISSQTLANGGNTSVTLTDKFSDPDSESAVQVITNLGTMNFILYNAETPQTVTNFLSYVNNASSSGNYNGAVFHRSVPGFVVQGGGFKVQSAPNNFSSITTTTSPTNEPGISNLRGTVAMAKFGSNPNSATDQFFVNLADNSSNLDNQNGGFTAFARVAGSGMSVADAMAALPTVNATVNVDGTANSSLTGWPVTSGSTMDTTKMVTITSAAPVAVLSYSVTGNSNPTAVSASISGTNVQITGSAGGQSSVTVTATDLDGNTASQTFAVTVNQAPTITSTALSTGGTVGAAFNFSYAASGYPAPTFTVPANALPPGLSLSSAGVISGTCTTAGTYSGVVTATNSSGTNTQGFSITVSKGAATVTLNSGSLAQTYDGTAKVATATTTPNGLTVTYTYNSLSTAPTTAGSYTVVGTISDTNYQGTTTGTLIISKATGTVTLNSGSLAQTYDGTAKVATATTTPNGLTVTYTYNSLSTAPTTAGSYTVVGTISDTNYQGTATGTLIISKATATVTLNSGSLAQTYDGTAKVATATTNPTGKTVTFTYNGLSTPPISAGSYTVVGTIVDTNYAGTSLSGTLVISQATATIALSNTTQTYDGTAKAVTATTNPIGLSVSITYNSSSTAPSGFGTYTVAASITDPNYTGSQGGSLTIQGQSSSSWKAQHFTAGQVSAGLSADNADPDGDTLQNLAEYALGTDPLVRNTPPQPTYDVNGLTLIFTRPKALPNVTYTAQSTDSLGSWNAVTLEVITDGPVQTIRARDPLTSGNTSRRFMHLIFGAQ